MKRNNSGGTLWLIIVSAIVVVLIGIAFLYYSRIFGGGIEVRNGVDAGMLNVAKQALVKPSVDAIESNARQFANLGDDNGSDVSVGTYNRAVALAILVAANAEEEGTPEAAANAREVTKQLEQLRDRLETKLENDPTLTAAFADCAEPNVPRMLGTGSKIAAQRAIDTGYYYIGGASNVYFTEQQLPRGKDMTPYLVPESEGGAAPGSNQWLAGYKPVKVGADTFYAVPVFPGKAPHLISFKDFGNLESVQGSNDYSSVLPNCFRKNGSATTDATNSDVVASAAGVVGALTHQYPARFPNGYIRIVNPPGINGGYQGAFVVDGSNDIFNNELYAPSNVTQSNNGVFSTDQAQMKAWVAYNNSQGNDENGHQPALQPGRLGFDVGKLRYGAILNGRPTRQQILAIRSLICTCTHTDYDRITDNDCEDETKVKTWETNYGRQSVKSPFTAGRPFISVEWLKTQCLDERGKVGPTYGSLLPPPDNSGLLQFQHGKSYPVPGASVQFAKTASPWRLMEQVGPCATAAGGNVFSRLFRRCRQIKPDCTVEEVKAVLDSKQIPLGYTLYLYADNSGRLKMDSEGPIIKTNAAPDGKRDVAQCLVQYPIEGTTINTASTRGPADATFNEKPWSKAVCPLAVDKCIWTDSSGYENLLGVIEFQNSVNGQSEFGEPN